MWKGDLYMVANQSRRVLATLRIEVQKCYHFASEPIIELVLAQ